ncbi:hypothetical protein M495_02225 [Serratia liquefaciens ATCC 27592]|nr:hypothetical protein M495_02225 [Serratia liquefaciens ATCC 27592]
MGPAPSMGPAGGINKNYLTYFRIFSLPCKRLIVFFAVRWPNSHLPCNSIKIKHGDRYSKRERNRITQANKRMKFWKFTSFTMAPQECLSRTAILCWF